MKNITKNMINNKTVQRAITFYGIGLHTSAKCAIKVSPANKGDGIKFIICGEEILLDSSSLNGSCLGTNIVGKTKTLRTVEHLLSSLSGLGITDAVVSTTDLEVPILDGSSAEFFNQIKSAGIHKLGMFEPKLVTKNIIVSDGEKFVEIKPSSYGERNVEFQISFDNKVVKSMPQFMVYHHSESSFYDQIAFARTFGFKRDLEALLSKNLCLGGSLDNAILIDDERVINIDGLRFQNEIISHKILDIIGDLYPLFREYTGFTIKANQAGHVINSRFLKKFMSDH
ncbi:UDP-3-O-acyl-N-acetylglucosamine deacetylase [Vibrio hepatarius]|uniref:UDP-3-O-acyl-N-acetylglucosamine deacetylase n=1 Tax=Vibrio hepatarius TaxID=171383 RepID=UPI001C093A2E|nr:UDP-3-O-acyl-N-acetylglucosamine deacetylase [Vibrio hepatarius]MBU2896032.1 UDP-3-O-acyl-N-acetylglucosamine deacetylase [Vibrio hepatarius]